MKKEICIAISKLSVGGAQRRAFTLANEFARNGYSVYILALSSNDSTLEINEYYNVEKNAQFISITEYYQKQLKDKKAKKIRTISDIHLFFLKSLQNIFNLIKLNVPSVDFRIKCIRKSLPLKSFLIHHKRATIISFEFDIFERVYFSSKNYRNKIIYAETNSSKRYESNIFYKQIKNYIKKSDAWVFQTKEERCEHNMENIKNAFVINNPVNSNLPEPYSGIRKPIVVNFCRLSRQKNLLLLIKAFENFLKSCPGFKLEIYADCSGCNDESYKEELLKYISEHTLGEYVKILPAISNVHNKILDYSMFVSSSDYEGISNSMIEAMAIGLPCVCTDCYGGGAREMITNEENGLLVPIGNIEAMTNAMIRMVTEKGLAEKCSKNAAKVKQTHSVEKIAGEWIKIIEYVQKRM